MRGSSIDEGGRHIPIFSDYHLQLYFHVADVTGVIRLPEGVEMCKAWVEMCKLGEHMEMEVELSIPIAMEKGQRFAIREEGRTVGAGVVTTIIK